MAKLCDFGWSVCAKTKRKTCCGTLDYTCPQVATGETYSKEIDVWAVGVLAFELLTGRTPFYHQSRDETMRSIVMVSLSLVSASFKCQKGCRREPAALSLGYCRGRRGPVWMSCLRMLFWRKLTPATFSDISELSTAVIFCLLCQCHMLPCCHSDVY